MDYILRLVYPGGKSSINMQQFFPANADKRKKLLMLIRESYEDPYELIDQVLEYLQQAVVRMEEEAGSAKARYKEYQRLAKDVAVYKNILSAAQRQVAVFENAKDRLIKEKQWWESHVR